MPSQTPPTRLELELWALGELDAARVSELEAMFEADADLRAHAESVRDQVVAAASDMPALAPLAALVPEPANRPLWSMPAFRGVVVLAAAVFFAVILRPTPPDDSVRFRGALDVEVHRVRLGAAELQGAIVTVRAGDRLQYSVTSSRDGYLSVFDLQDDGELSVWLEAEYAPAMSPTAGAVVLDNYRGSERVFFLHSPEPVTRSVVEASLSRAWDTPLAELDGLPGLLKTIDQRSILLVRHTKR